MRTPLNSTQIHKFMVLFGRKSRSAGNVYFTGGATAVLEGWRETTIDVDIRLDPEPSRAFEAISEIKQELDVNIELASPMDFIPPLPGWRERSRFIDTFGKVQFFHYDLYSQALAKLERSHTKDLLDVEAMFREGWLEKKTVLHLFETIEPELIRYPAIDPASFRHIVESVTQENEDEHEDDNKDGDENKDTNENKGTNKNEI